MAVAPGTVKSFGEKWRKEIGVLAPECEHCSYRHTAWIPAHCHTTVAGPVFLSFLGMSLYLVCRFRGVRVPLPRLNLWTPWESPRWPPGGAGTVSAPVGRPAEIEPAA